MKMPWELLPWQQGKEGGNQRAVQGDGQGKEHRVGRGRMSGMAGTGGTGWAGKWWVGWKRVH